MNQSIKTVIIVGGGTAGWMSAALLKRVFGEALHITLVESEQIGIVGVGEATIPPIQHVNSVLGINEAEFLRETKATIKLAIRFENWRKTGEQYYHTFGAPGRSQAFCQFHHFWTRAQQNGDRSSLWDYDLNYLCCAAGKFAKVRVDDPVWELPYAYHFDSALYGQFLRRYSERLGVKRIEGLIDDVTLDGQTGHVTAVQLAGGDAVAGDFFIDCSGARGLLIKQALEADFEDWGHWLPCDRALAVPSERFENTALFTRSIAHDAGWQWRIPLQHRNGNGLVYSSAHLDDNAAADRLMGNLDTRAQADPKLIRFQTGRTRQQWHRNVTAIGLSSGFLEPLESTSIYLIQSAIVRLIHLFPHQGVTKQLVDEYNRQAKIEWETIRDFIILHYHLNERDDGDFWKDVRHMSIPDRIRQKIDMFRSNGTLQQDQFDIFLDPSWLQVMLGQGVTPRDYHPLADNVTDSQLREKLINTHKTKQQPLERLPTHDEFLRAACEA